MSYKILAPAWDTNLPASQKILLVSLADQANDDGVCWPSIASLMHRTGLQERTVYKHLSELEDMGHIERQQRSGKSTVYHVHPCTTCTPAQNAPLHPVHPTPAPGAPPPLHHMHPTPAPGAPITVIEPKEEPKEQKPCANGTSLTSRARADETAASDAQPSPAGEGEGGMDAQPDSNTLTPGAACMAMRQVGMSSTNPAHPRLLAMLDAGITACELQQAAIDAVQTGKGFAYALAIAEGRRSDLQGYQHLPPYPSRAKPAEPAWRALERERIAKAVPGIAERVPNTMQTIDVQARSVGPPVVTRSRRHA